MAPNTPPYPSGTVLRCGNPNCPTEFVGDGFQMADDAQTVLLGRLNKANKAPPSAVAGKTYQGPVGYVID